MMLTASFGYVESIAVGAEMVYLTRLFCCLLKFPLKCPLSPVGNVVLVDLALVMLMMVVLNGSAPLP
jgi:hypothetical protein